MQTVTDKLAIAAVAAILTLWQPALVLAQSSEVQDQPSIPSDTQVIRLRVAERPVGEPTLPISDLTESQQQALFSMAVAVDEASLSDLEAAFAALDCGEDCGPLLDAQFFLHRAARDATPAIIERLLLAGASIDHISPPLAWTPLLVALQAARTENATALVSFGANLHLVGLDGTSAPFLADLLDLGNVIPFPPVQLSLEDANRTLLLAIEANNLIAVRFALNAGADPRVTSPANGWSALMIASFHGFFDVARVLLDDARGAGADLVAYAEPEGGLTALHATLLGARRADPQPHVCTLAVLLANGASLETTTRAGFSVRDVATNTETFGMLTDAAPYRDIEASCVERFGAEEYVELVDAVLPTALVPSVASGAPQAAPAPFEGSQEDLVTAIQVTLDQHACRPGSADGDFGPATVRALRLYNMARPESCAPVATLPQIRRDQPNSDWRTSAISSLYAMEQCRPTTACGGAPGPDFYLEHAQGCWYHSVVVLPDEHASWDGSCDALGYVDGRGTLSFTYPSGAPGYQILRMTLTMRAGRPADGVSEEVTIDGSVLSATYRGGIRHGSYSARAADGSFTSRGQFEDGLRTGTWQATGRDGYERSVEYVGGEPIRATIRYADGSTYEGAVDADIRRNGLGTYTFPSGRETLSGRWIEDRVAGARFVD